MPERIGIEGVFNLDHFDAGINRYTKAIGQATPLTQRLADSINWFAGNVATGAARRIGELAVDGFMRAGQHARTFTGSVQQATRATAELEQTSTRTQAAVARAQESGAKWRVSMETVRASASGW